MSLGPFQIARWTLFAGFAVMVLIVSLPNPEPSADWKIAETRRYRARFPELRNRGEFPPERTGNRLAETPDEGSIKDTGGEPSETIRTAQLPIRENGDRRSKASVENRDSENLVPDPIHLDCPGPRS